MGHTRGREATLYEKVDKNLPPLEKLKVLQQVRQHRHADDTNAAGNYSSVGSQLAAMPGNPQMLDNLEGRQSTPHIAIGVEKMSKSPVIGAAADHSSPPGDGLAAFGQ